MSLNVRVITPDKVVWDADAEELILPSSTGQLGILTDHAPLLTALDIGVMRLKSGNNWTSIVLMEGFAEVEANKVTILCNGAEEASSINLKTAQEELVGKHEKAQVPYPLLENGLHVALDDVVGKVAHKGGERRLVYTHKS